jgi:ribonuclease HI
MKFYAVRIGREPGIYTTWEQAKKQVMGFSGAKYKSFKTRKEAENFMGNVISNKRENKSKVSERNVFEIPIVYPIQSETKKELKTKNNGILQAYVDGSHIKGTNKLGYGILCVVEDGPEYVFSCNPINVKRLSSLFGNYINIKRLSNPTMEFIAVAHLIYLIATEGRKRFKQLNIHYDYIGSVKWITGAWQAKQPHIKVIYNFVMPYVTQLKEQGIKINWIHIPAHSGNRENDIADALAKGEALLSQFQKKGKGSEFKPLKELFPSVKC